MQAIYVIYYQVIWTDNGNRLPEANPRRQEGKYPMIKVLQGCICKLSLHSVNSVLLLYRTGNMQSAILLSFIASSSLPPYRLQSTCPPMLFYISPYVVHNFYGAGSVTLCYPLYMYYNNSKSIYFWILSTRSKVSNQIQKWFWILLPSSKISTRIHKC